ncbi:hypothetical protein AAFC00_001357 [Neodothiora populina]|uniref:RRM domain-containing protein n=1 Tax=Neodothiora populina TaxID=2781224 RepID=A0ABR3PNU3_9PEZI
MSTMEYENDQRGYDDEPSYPRERSRSPRPDRDGDSRIRSASPAAREDRGPPSKPRGTTDEEEEEAANPGSNLFVTGIHPRLTEDEVRRLFEKYGDVETCSIMRDPHTRESRGFGFVKMVTSEQADAAKSGLQGEVYEGRTLSIEKARRARPRTPTPGKYFGPPKRDDRRGGRREFGGGFSGGRRDDYRRRDDRGYGGRDYERRGGGYGGRDYERGGYDRSDRDRDYGRRDRDYYSSRDDRYSSRGDDSRRGGDYASFDRPSRGAADAAPAYASGDAPAEGAGSRRGYGDDRYERR